MPIAAGQSAPSTAYPLRSPAARRLAAVVALGVVGCLDYVAGTGVATAPFYLPVLLTLAFFEPWAICLAFSLLAAAISLRADLSWEPARLASVHPYWSAFARLVGFGLISGTVCLLVRERRHLREFERVLRANAEELQIKNRALEESLRETTRLREDLTRKERQAAIGDAMFVTAYEMERPLASASVYLEEMTRLVERAGRAGHAELVLDEFQPLLEKLRERMQSMERVLEEIRDLHKSGPLA
jgi:signal transduction histidine kinase